MKKFFDAAQPKSNRDLILKEYPFLQQYIVGDLTSIRVVKMTMKLLKSYPHTEWFNSKNSRSSGPFYHRMIFLLGTDGHQIAAVEPNNVVRQKQLRLFSPKTWFPLNVTGQTVFEAITSLSDPNDIRFVVEVRHYPEQVVGMSQDPEQVIVLLHKIPNKSSMVDFTGFLLEEEVLGDLPL
ncbi:hypothetical protein CL652_00360 [bacterium]|nr:hypothetical protein [bacterium]|tara:strand:+ start:1438 stop:1977 length:540 start_codon:yes stop_codon:yes gene_type:complete